MKVFFSQIYIEVGVTFQFSIRFQQRLSTEVSALLEPSPLFSKKFGADWNLMIRISAKRQIGSTEIRGPTAFRKDRSIEFTLFLPFDALQLESDVDRGVVRELIHAACDVLERFDFSTARIRAVAPALIESVCSDPAMFDRQKRA